jgi:hypothetical protein
VKEDSKQFNEMMARCLAGECSEAELERFLSILSGNHDLKTEYELIKTLFGKEAGGIATSDKRNFDRIKTRLKKEGLM